MVSVPVWLWPADLQASITLVFGVLLSYPREFGLVLAGMSMWLDRQPYNVPSIPTCRFFTSHWKLPDTLWCVLLHGTYSTSPLASSVKVLPLTCLLIYRPQFLSMHPACHEQLCPVVLVSIFTKTSFNLKVGEPRGKQKLAERTRHSLPALLLFEGTILSCTLRDSSWPPAVSPLSFVQLHPAHWFQTPGGSQWAIMELLHETLHSWFWDRSSPEAASMGCHTKEGSQELRAIARQVGQWSHPEGHSPTVSEQVPHWGAGWGRIQGYQTCLEWWNRCEVKSANQTSGSGSARHMDRHRQT